VIIDVQYGTNTTSRAARALCKGTGLPCSSIFDDNIWIWRYKEMDRKYDTYGSDRYEEGVEEG